MEISVSKHVSELSSLWFKNNNTTSKWKKKNWLRSFIFTILNISFEYTWQIVKESFKKIYEV